MRIKGKLVILILTCVIIVSAGFWYVQKEINRDGEVAINTEVGNVVDEVSVKYQVQSTQIINGGKNPSISISVSNENNVLEVENYLKDNLSSDELGHYELDVFSNDEA